MTKVKIKLLDNEFGEFLVKLEEEVEFTCLGGPTRTQLKIRYVPDKHLLEFMSFRDWLNENYTRYSKNGTIESVGYEIYNVLARILGPKQLEVINSGGRAPRHGPASATFGRIDWK